MMKAMMPMIIRIARITEIKRTGSLSLIPDIVSVLATLRK